MEAELGSGREELIKNIEYTHEILLSAEENDKKYKKIFKNPININPIIHIILFLFLIWPYGDIFGVFFGPIARMLENVIPLGFLVDLVAIILTIITYVILYNLLLHNLNKKYTSYHNDKNKVVLSELQQTNEKLHSDLAQYSIVPLKYRHIYCTEKLIDYLKNFRADSLKEAINLYESTEQHHLQINEIKKMQALQADTNQELSSVNASLDHLGRMQKETKRSIESANSSLSEIRESTRY
ncbi:hypothetical protein [Jeotgalibacillus malaysiensis]|uniref:hypothetical protein n=1 Tax=Jeotgalibacillus malaysiensis TaxID=1508404 RepID=UPI00384FD518